ncbi:AAA family ATPase [Ferroacidibacillus organovorans]|uniref:AAA+ ATPase domain-containing protein n=1 Tax=Ferroacidibacillus organovorans TaxID=1765683 RepID=A0A162TQI3_9BACL|nr:AAA family ATPase [Ferroacidibacillus organovorans]KYP80619.1 hypothetical protein AYJ22_10585 [Ferroacidibacillus organovorans]KYP81026.1 hypothetical protein AYJ22_09260 [Ferroacidibacillus organovorans]OAG94305.1 hypothetical protein AYW79_06120 [Ferroacidibacillus organovorans]OPG16455.1 hypothetical protein B2M26_06140 [Ferroacidibacillus organovorans]
MPHPSIECRDHALRSVLPWLPQDIADELMRLPSAIREGMEEIRLRAERPLEVSGIEQMLLKKVTRAQISHVVQAITGSSLYAVEAELRRGYITLPGGHRVGLAGHVSQSAQAQIETMTQIGSCNIRLARAVLNFSRRLAPILVKPQGSGIRSALIVGPPRTGKTTLLRDLARTIGSGSFDRRLPRLRVAIVDERSEIAACHEGVPQFDVGISTDVLDAAPKIAGMSMMLRAMSPDVIITDEIGDAGDAGAVADVTRAGVSFIGSIHGGSLADVRIRHLLADLRASGAVERFILIGRSGSEFAIQNVYDETLREVTGWASPSSSGWEAQQYLLRQP